MRAAVDATVAAFGRLDVAFDNGATIPPPGPLDEVAEADFDRFNDVNLKAVFVAMAAQVAAIRATAGTGRSSTPRVSAAWSAIPNCPPTVR